MFKSASHNKQIPIRKDNVTFKNLNNLSYIKLVQGVLQIFT